jgi:rubrerythrin
MEKNDIYEQTQKLCPILYKNRCSWSINFGWFDLLNNFSLSCEEINLFYYDKFRYRIELDEVKEKYGTLRIYFSIIKDPPKLISMVINWLMYIKGKWLSQDIVNYQLKKVIDTPRCKKITFEILSDYNKDEHCSNENITKINNNYVKTSTVYKFETYHYEAQQYKLRYKLSKLITEIINKLERITFIKDNDNTIHEILFNKVSELVVQCEKKSAYICEHCGMNMENTPDIICSTAGYISTLCEHCARKSKRVYYKGNKKFKNGKEINDENPNIRTNTSENI